jgi:hypothetical protein
MVVVADTPAPDLVEQLAAAGAFPIVEAPWTEAPTAFVSIKPAAVIIAEPGKPSSDANARMLCLQIATAQGPITPVFARALPDQDAPVPTALPVDTALPHGRLIDRIKSGLRVRALHATVLRRIETFASENGDLPSLPVGDALDDATVLIAGRGALYPKLSAAMGARVGTVGALSVETAARHMNSRDIDGIVLGDGFTPRMAEAFLTVLAQDERFREVPIVTVGDVPADLADQLTNMSRVTSEPMRAVARMLPMARMRAFETRLKRMLKTLETEGMFDADTGLHSHDHFISDLAKTVADAEQSGHALSIARIALSGALDGRAQRDGARLVTRLTRNIDFACQDRDGALLVVFSQTCLRDAHLVARRMAASLRAKMLDSDRGDVHAEVTLATLKANDNVDTLLRRVMGSAAIAAE